MASSAPLGELTHVAGRSSAGPQRLYGVVGRRVAAPEEGERKGLLRKPRGWPDGRVDETRHTAGPGWCPVIRYNADCGVGATGVYIIVLTVSQHSTLLSPHSSAGLWSFILRGAFSPGCSPAPTRSGPYV